MRNIKYIVLYLIIFSTLSCNNFLKEKNFTEFIQNVDSVFTRYGKYFYEINITVLSNNQKEMNEYIEMMFELNKEFNSKLSPYWEKNRFSILFNKNMFIENRNSSSKEFILFLIYFDNLYLTMEHASFYNNMVFESTTMEGLLSKLVQEEKERNRIIADVIFDPILMNNTAKEYGQLFGNKIKKIYQYYYINSASTNLQSNIIYDLYKKAEYRW